VKTLLAVLALAAALHAEEPRPPNVVLIVADDLGWAETGAQGATDVPTPAIDSIAREGVRFRQGYVTCPVCAPTRAGLLTGRYGQRFGFEFNPGPERSAEPDFGLPTTEKTLAESLRARGYATGMVGKWHLGYRAPRRPTERGFDEFFGFLAGAHPYRPRAPRNRAAVLRGLEPVDEPLYLTDAFAREAAAFIDRHAKEPFFLYLAFNAVHAPLQARDDAFAAIADPRRRAFASMLAAMDEAIGKVLLRLREHGIEERTLVFFLSDNGGPTPQTSSRNTPLRGFKGQVFEGGIRVPFLVRWKGTIPAGRVFEAPVSSLDVVPTALAAAGAEASGLDGVDLLPFLRGEREGRPHDALFWRFGDQAAVRVGDFKLVMAKGTTMLFDLAADAGESKDVLGDQEGRGEEMKAAYDRWSSGLAEPLWKRSGAGPAHD
jgi:arylsulfatase A-like enzyme